MINWLLRIFWLVVLLGIVGTAVRSLPPEHNPIADLSMDDPIGITTEMKLARFAHEPDACFAYLDRSEIAYTRLDDSPEGENCGFYDALTLDRSELPYSGTLRMTCALTGALATWERQGILPRASEELASPPVRIMTYGSYVCRRKYGRSTGSFSEHATGNAVDIWGFELENGQIISVKSHWGTDTAEGRFLKAMRNDACRLFGTVLGPEYNAAHADHFHFDMSFSGICR